MQILHYIVIGKTPGSNGKPPFQHPSFKAAHMEQARLCEKYPNQIFTVYMSKVSRQNKRNLFLKKKKEAPNVK